MDATDNVDLAMCELHGEKTEKRKSKKRKMKGSLSAEENLETDGEKLAGEIEMKDSGIVETTGTAISDAVQEGELVLKSFPAVVDDKIASEDKCIDLDTTGDVVASGTVHKEKKGAKRKKRSRRKNAVSVAAISENNMGGQTQNKGIEQKTGNKATDVNEMIDQNGALRKSSPLRADGNIIFKETIDQGATENDFTLLNPQDKRKDEKTLTKLKKKALFVSVNPEQNLETGSDKVVSHTPNNKLEHIIGKTILEGTEMCDGGQEGCLLPTSSTVGADDNIISKDKIIVQDVTDNFVTLDNVHVGKKDEKTPETLMMKKDLAFDVDPLQILQKEGEKVAFLTENDELEQATDNKAKEGTEVHDQKTLSPQNQTAIHLSENAGKEEIVLDVKKTSACADQCVTASEFDVLDAGNPVACKKKWRKRKRKSSSVSQSDLNDRVGEIDTNMESSSVNDGESKHSIQGNNVAPAECIPLTASISIYDSKKDVCRLVSCGEAIHEKIILPSPKRPCDRPSSRKLLILDINGLLADIIAPVPVGYKPDLMLSRKAVFKRPFCESFLKFCFEQFDVGVWSSRVKINVDNVLNYLMGEMKNKLIFYWDRSHCTITGFPTIENRDKPLVLKELRKLWDDHQVHLGKYDQTNTLLLDDSPYKALCNPAYTAIFPLSYQYKDVNDCSLGPEGDLRVYLERLAMAENIPEFVRKNPFGQRPIRETNLSWNYYKKVIDSHTRKTI